ELSGLVFSLEQDVTGAAEAAAEARVVELESKIATLNLELEQRRSWVFDTQATQWQFEVLSELVRGAESIERDLLAEDAVRPRLGWSMPKRIAFAETLRAGFAEGGSYSAAWAEALPAIRSAYPGLDLAPQMGLLPIGPDPDSHLWEFAHLMSGTPARRGTDGRLALNDEVGFVLVLLPGGTFWMGAQARDPTFHNYDPNVDFDEGPVHLTELSPFFLSKYELTQGQWLRLTGDNPSFFRPGALDERLRVLGETPTLLHPLEQVSWDDCATWLPRLGLALPSEAQWEFGYRAGTGTPWWTGNEKESLAGVANLLDRFAHKHASTFWIGVEEWLDDGAGFQQRIGSYRPNAFGLHDVAGNVEEWCLDGYDWSFHARAPRLNPVSAGDVGDERVFRGGHYAYSALVARASTRSNLNKSSALPTIGVRPARALER
ncbi:MAG TPA: formylglycine-generating enzyme family protein, partial [Planctomycetota bacterium]|nr:formylglycine-generating enzyme family protein [Planctomycetota bacterium]